VNEWVVVLRETSLRGKTKEGLADQAGDYMDPLQHKFGFLGGLGSEEGIRGGKQ